MAKKYLAVRLIPVYDAIDKQMDKKGNWRISYYNLRWFGVDRDGFCHKQENCMPAYPGALGDQ